MQGQDLMAHDILTGRQRRGNRDDPLASLVTDEELGWPLGIGVAIEVQLVDLHPHIPLVALERRAVVVGALCEVSISTKESTY